MPPETALIAAFQRELDHGRNARRENNEGMARVCARRAAGILVRAYYESKGVDLPGASALNHLRALATAPDEPRGVQEVARHFIRQIDHDHVLPEGIDLLAEVEWLRSALFPA